MKILKLKLSGLEFGEICNQVQDASERGELRVPTSIAVRLVGHIQVVLQEQIEMEKRLNSIIVTAIDNLQGFDRVEKFPSNIRKIIQIADGENS